MGEIKYSSGNSSVDNSVSFSNNFVPTSSEVLREITEHSTPYVVGVHVQTREIVLQKPDLQLRLLA
jgi:hypothetical protein